MKLYRKGLNDESEKVEIAEVENTNQVIDAIIRDGRTRFVSIKGNLSLTDMTPGLVYRSGFDGYTYTLEEN